MSAKALRSLAYHELRLILRQHKQVISISIDSIARSAWCLVLLLLLSSCSEVAQQTGDDKPVLPIYAGASDIQVQAIPKSSTNDLPTEITTFLTKDKPDLVLSYYTKELGNAGWRPNSPLTPVPDKTYFSKGPPSGQRTSSYGLVITITQQDEETFNVELNMAEYLPY